MVGVGTFGEIGREDDDSAVGSAGFNNACAKTLARRGHVGFVKNSSRESCFRIDHTEIVIRLRPVSSSNSRCKGCVTSHRHTSSVRATTAEPKTLPQLISTLRQNAAKCPQNFLAAFEDEEKTVMYLHCLHAH